MPVLKLTEGPALFSSALRWAFNVLLLSQSSTSNNIPCRVWSLGWKPDGPGILSTGEAIVLHVSSRESTPHMSSQQSLVGTLSASLGSADGVGDDIGPYALPQISPHLSSQGRFRTPQPAKHVSSVLRMVSHHVQ